MSGQITALYASLIGLLLIYLSFRIASNRKNKQIGIGTNGDNDLERMVRTQANLVEYAPIALLLLFFCEIRGVDHMYIHIFGVLLVVARILHAMGLSKSAGYTRSRFIGALLTFLLIVLLSGINIVHYFID